MRLIKTIIVVLIVAATTNSQVIPTNLYNRMGLPIHLQKKIEETQASIKAKGYSLDSISKLLLGQLLEQILKPVSLKELIVSGRIQELVEERGQIEDVIYAGIENQLCINHTRHFFENATSLWAIQMIDSWGKFPDGILSGHTSSHGDFEECLQIRGVYDNGVDSSQFKGQYCLTYLIPSFVGGEKTAEASLKSLGNYEVINQLQNEAGLNRGVVLTPQEFLVMLMSTLLPQRGTCFPSSCSKDDVTLLFMNTFALLNVTFLTQLPMGCYTDEKPDFSAGTIAMICLLSLIAALCILGTLADVLLYKKAPAGSPLKGTGMKALVAFSLYTNTIKLFSTNSGADSLGCLHGLRFWSMSWVVLGHTWVVMMGNQPLWNVVDFYWSYDTNFTIMAILNATFSVDTFFVLSGTLASYNILKLLDKTKGRLNVPFIYLHRFLRITPTYMMILGIMATLMPYAGFGPNWSTIDMEAERCRKYWWHNLLYFNNVAKLPEGEGGCYQETWYLANDMQFFLISPLFIYPMWRWKRIGMTLLGLGHLVSVITPTVIKYMKELPPTVIVTFPEALAFTDKIYYKPWTRIGPYLIGIFLGYILNTQSKSTMSKGEGQPGWVLPAWTICTVAAMSLIFGVQRYFDPANKVETLTSFWSAIYTGFGRYVWGWCMAWIIYACVNGYGGWINDFLSWKPFIPLGRLTFCVYMVSQHLQMIFHQQTLHPWHYSVYTGVNIFFAHMVMSLLVASVVTLTLEFPFMQLEKLLFPERGGRAKNGGAPISSSRANKDHVEISPIESGSSPEVQNEENK